MDTTHHAFLLELSELEKVALKAGALGQAATAYGVGLPATVGSAAAGPGNRIKGAWEGSKAFNRWALAAGVPASVGSSLYFSDYSDKSPAAEFSEKNPVTAATLAALAGAGAGTAAGLVGARRAGRLVREASRKKLLDRAAKAQLKKSRSVFNPRRYFG